MPKRNFESEFKELMICAAAHDEKTAGSMSYHVEQGRKEDELVYTDAEFEAHVLASVAEYFALNPDDMVRVLNHAKDCQGVNNAQA